MIIVDLTDLKSIKEDLNKIIDVCEKLNQTSMERKERLKGLGFTEKQNSDILNALMGEI